VSADDLRSIVEAVKAEALRVRRCLDDAELTRITGTIARH